MKTQDLFNEYHDLESSKKSLEEDLKNRQQSIETAEHHLKGLYKEHVSEYITPVLNSLIEKGDWEKVNEIFGLLYKIPVLDSEIKLIQFPEEKEKLPKMPKEVGPITDKGYYTEFIKFLKKSLNKSAFEGIISGIEWSEKEGRMTGSKPTLIVGLNDFDKANNEPCRTLTTHQTWKFNHLFKDKNWVEAGYYLNGNKTNSETATHFIKQFEKRGLAKDGVLYHPMKIDLYRLTFNGNKEGLIYLTDDSIYSQTEDLQNGDYKYSELTEYGIWIKSESGWTVYVPSGNGFYRCYFGGGLDSYAGNESLGGSSPNGLVVRKLA